MASPTLLAGSTLRAFGKRMREMRLEAGMKQTTQTQLARRSYMLRSFISRIERGIAIYHSRRSR
jgi:transcriptional regulator with XRE-family HTH domain